jgi:hypothetical protein
MPERSRTAPDLRLLAEINRRTAAESREWMVRCHAAAVQLKMEIATARQQCKFAADVLKVRPLPARVLRLQCK